MGTGSLAVAIVASPIPIPGASVVGPAVSMLAMLVFAIFFPLLTLRVFVSPRAFVAMLRDPAKAQLWGLPPMAAFAVVVVLVRIVGPHGGGDLAIAAAQALWLFGVAGSVFSAFFVPYLMVTEHDLRPDEVLGTWVLPVVPPVVAALPAALLLPTFPAPLRPSILVAAYALLSVGCALTALTIAIYYARLLFHKIPTGGLAPGMWLIVGPLGQSIAGAYTLAGSAAEIWPAFGNGFILAAVVYGMVVWGFANYWLALSIVVTVRAVRAGMPFSQGWWAFTFATGMLTAGTDALFRATHAGLFALAAVVQLAMLAALWTLVAALTLRDVLRARKARRQRSLAHRNSDPV